MRTQLSFISILLFIFISSVAHSETAIGAKAAEQTQTPSIEQMLTFAIQDEYLAHAEYVAIIDKYGTIRPFSNIVEAEVTHINMLKPLFATYGFAVPVDNAADHILLPADLKTAFEIGVQAEIDNIKMYKSFLQRTLPDDVRAIFEYLLEASEKHLQAFTRGLSRYK